MDREEKKGFMEDKSKYFVVKQRAVPEVLLKVVEAKKLLETVRSAEVLFTNIRTIFFLFTTIQRGRLLHW